MVHRILHVWRNTPFGRETLAASAYLAERIGAELELIQPTREQLLLRLGGELVTLSLDSSYLSAPASARAHAEAQLAGQSFRWLAPAAQAAEELPVFADGQDFLTSPRAMSERTSRIGLGVIGTGVRRIVHCSTAPVLIPAAVFRPWTRVVAFFGGSDSSRHAVERAGALAHAAGLPLTLFTHADASRSRDELEAQLEQLGPAVPTDREWLFREGVALEEALMDVPRDALLVLGAYGHGRIKRRLFGGFAETVQSVMPMPLLLLGPRVPGGLR